MWNKIDMLPENRGLYLVYNSEVISEDAIYVAVYDRPQNKWFIEGKHCTPYGWCDAFYTSDKKTFSPICWNHVGSKPKDYGRYIVMLYDPVIDGRYPAIALYEPDRNYWFKNNTTNVTSYVRSWAYISDLVPKEGKIPDSFVWHQASNKPRATGKYLVAVILLPEKKYVVDVAYYSHTMKVWSTNKSIYDNKIKYWTAFPEVRDEWYDTLE